MTVTSIVKISQLVSTSVASYGDLQGGVANDAALKTALTTGQYNPNFTYTQAEAFVSQYRLLDQQPNVLLNGFSATVFEDKQTGKHIIAMRGTEVPVFPDQTVADLLVTDGLSIGGNGFANNQAVEMIRYYKKLVTPGGRAVQYSEQEQWQLFAVKNSLLVPLASKVPALTATLAASFLLFKQELVGDVGVVPTYDSADESVLSPIERVDVTGHSLGGHLAILFSRFFPDNVDQVVTLNAPGLFSQGDAALVSIGFQPPDASRITRVEADGDGISEIGTIWPGATITIAQESSGGPIAALSSNHSSVNGNDAMALMSLLAKLDDRFLNDAPGLSELLRAASNDAGNTYEALLDAVRRALLGPSVESTATSYGAADPRRAALYDGMQLLEKTPAFQAMLRKATLTLPGAGLDAQVKTNFGALIALLELHPVVLGGVDGTANAELTAIWQSTRATDHANWQSDLNARLNGDTSHAYTYTDAWYADRATLLQAIVARNIKNGDTIAYSSSLPTDRIYDLHWVDADGMSQILFAENTDRPGGVTAPPARQEIRFGGAAADVLTGSDFNKLGDHVYGGSGNDTLVGLGGNDYLEGNADGDHLHGGTGNDLLLGGTGTDLYVFTSGDGHDTILDADGAGTIRIGLDILTGGMETTRGGSIWQSTDKRYRYQVETHDDGNRTLRIFTPNAGDQITVQHFVNGHLGIQLDNLPPLLPGEYGSVIIGDRAPIDADPADPGLQTTRDVLGNVLTDPNRPEPGRSDVMYDSAADDLVQGLAGGDDLRAIGGGNDRLEAGGGEDYADGGVGHDDVLGGAGVDILRGGEGDDRLFGDGELALNEAITLGRSQEASNQRGDWLNGNNGADVLIAGADNDVLFGGGGSDILVGGAGDDVIDADDDYDAVDRDWTIVVPANGNLFDRLYTLVYNNNWSGESSGADLAYGGQGNDYLFGNSGDDFLHGEADNDTLAGGDGDDMLFGGSGNDSLAGDFGAVEHYASGAPVTPGNDRLHGGGGNDELHGNAGDDLLDGGADDDLLLGGKGSDTYIYALGDGNDVLQELYVSGDLNTLELGPGLSSVEVTLSFDADGYVFTMPDAATLRLNGNYGFTRGEDGSYHIQGEDQADLQRVVFGDGQSQLWLELLLQSGFTQVGTASEVVVKGTQYNDLLRGGTAHAELRAGAGHDRLEGGNGDNRLLGGSGSDTLTGGRGDDTLLGGAGDDTYVVSAGDGADILIDSDGANVLRLGVGLSAQDVRLQRINGDLVLSWSGGTQQLTLRDWGTQSAAPLARIEFADGVVWDTATIDARALAEPLGGTSGDDTFGPWRGETGPVLMAGGDGADTYHVAHRHTRVTEAPGAGHDVVRSRVDYTLGLHLEDLYLEGDAVRGTGNAMGNLLRANPSWGSWLTGGAGNDILLGASGADYLDGGSGDDELIGGGGSDTFSLKLGDGLDRIEADGSATIVFGAGVTAQSLRTRFEDGAMVLEYGDAGDAVRMARGSVRELRFADGTQVRLSRFFQGFGGYAVVGTDNLDTWFVGDYLVDTSHAASVFQGLRGDDIMVGGGGATTYRVDFGDGLDTIVDLGGSDTLSFGKGVRLADLGFSEWEGPGGVSLAIQYSRHDEVVVAAGTIEWLRFADGKVCSLDALRAEYGGQLPAPAVPLFRPLPLPGGAWRTPIVVTGESGRDVYQADDQTPHVFIMGAGDDVIEVMENDGYGPQTVVLGLGDGADRVAIDQDVTYLFREGVDAQSLRFSQSAAYPVRYGNQTVWFTDEIVHYGTQGDLLTIEGSASGWFEFANGDRFTADEMRSLARRWHGSGGGELRPEVFQFNRGDGVALVHQGTVTIGDRPSSAGTTISTVQFGPGIHRDMLSLDIAGNLLVVRVGDAGDEVRIANFDRADIFAQSQISEFTFTDGAVLGYAELLAQGFDLRGTAGGEALLGTTTQDRLQALAGDDTLDGGAADDLLVGGMGNDVYRFGRGSGRDRVVEDAAGDGLDAVQFASDLAPGDVEAIRNREDLELRIIGTADCLVLTNWYVSDAHKVEEVRFADGTVWSATYLAQVAPLLPMVGTPADDVLTSLGGVDNHLLGLDGNDMLAGSGGADLLDGGLGNDLILGGAGSDTLLGGGGNDSYVFAQGSGRDTIVDAQGADGEIDTVVFGPGISATDLELTQHADRLEMSLGGADVLTILQDRSRGIGVEMFAFDDGSLVALDALPAAANRAPVAQDVPADLRAEVGQAWSYRLSPTVFHDANPDDVLQLQLHDAEGGALPGWLHFEPSTGTLSGSPGSDALGEHLLRLTATDPHGASVSVQFRVQVTPTNHAPQTMTALPDLWVGPGEGLGIALPDQTFFDPDEGDVLLLRATRADGTALPSWLHFDADSGYFSGRTPEVPVGAIAIRVSATDLAGAGTSATFHLVLAQAPLWGSDRSDALLGGEGADILHGQAGDDLLAGGAGPDLYVITRGGGSDTITDSPAGGPVHDTVQFEDRDVRDLVLRVDAARTLRILMDGGDEVALGDVDAILVGGGSVGAFVFQDGRVFDMQALAEYLDIEIEGSEGADVVVGTSAGDRIRGGGGDDVLQGAGGYDTLLGGAGMDRLAGGDGDDRLFGDGAQDAGDGMTVTSLSVLARGSAYDNVWPTMEVWIAGVLVQSFTVGTSTMATYTVAAPLGMVARDLQVVFTNDAYNPTTGQDRNLWVDSITVNGRIVSAQGAGTVLDQGLGVAARDGLLTTVSKGVLSSNGAIHIGLMADGDDLDGGAGADDMFGGGGHDLYHVDDANDLLVEGADGGHDIVRSSVDWTLGADFEDLELTGTAAIHATGNDAPNTLRGNSAGNRLDGGAGADMLVGGAGDDTYIVDNIGDGVHETAGQGMDTVLASVTYSLQNAEVENLVLTGLQAISGTGNASANRVTGNSAANTLSGLAGQDSLDGGGGNDRLLGGDGNDILVGDGAQDAGDDLTITSLSVLARGSAYDNVWPTMEVWVGGRLVQSFTVNSTAHAPYTVTAPLGMAARDVQVVFTNDAYNATTGQDRNLWVDSITVNGRSINARDAGTVLDQGAGAAARDGLLTTVSQGVLSSNGAILIGLMADGDHLDGGAGADTMTGGWGHDVYHVDNVAEVLAEQAGGGHDIVRSSVDWTLGADFEDLELTGTAALHATGNDAGNTLRGNGAGNRLDGGAGADMLVGGAGDDTYIVDNAGDGVHESAGQGTDTVLASVTYTLQNAEVENLTLTGMQAIHGTGNAAANLILGNSNANALSGHAGDDTLVGGSGNDRLLGGDGSDVLVGDGALDDGAGMTVTSLSVLARGSAYDAVWPTMEVWIGGALVQRFTVDTAASTTYTVTAPLGMGARDVFVVFTNDAYNAATGQDRNLWVDSITVNGRTISARDAGTVLDQGSGAAARDGLLTTVSQGVLATHSAIRIGLMADGDHLDGGTGADTMAGGWGNDLYHVDNTADVPQEQADAGHDIVRASVDWTLGTHFEDLELVGTEAIDGTGNAGGNTLRGNGARNRLDGGASADVLLGGSGDDVLLGGTGDDTLRGGDGSDVLQGDGGSDLLEGGAGADIYRFARGSGWDTLVENDGAPGQADVLELGPDIQAEQIWLSRSGNHLRVGVIGTGDTVSIQNWFLGASNHVEEIRTSDGRRLLDSQVQSLVDAMAAFAPPAMGQSTLPAAHASQLQPVIAAHWQ